MAKEDYIEVEAVVVEALPNSQFKVRLENGAVILLIILALPGWFSARLDGWIFLVPPLPRS